MAARYAKEKVGARPFGVRISAKQSPAGTEEEGNFFPLAFRNRNRNRNRNRMSRLFDHEKLEVYRASLS